MGNKKIVDLTFPVRDDMMVYPGLARPVFQWMGRDFSEGYNSTKFIMEIHTGTHIDAPLHFVPNGDPIDRLSLDHFYGQAQLCRLAEEPTGQEISLDTLAKQCPPVKKGQILVLDTGVYRYFGQSDFFKRYPVLTDEAAQWLIDSGVVTLATDAPSVDPVGTPTAPIHHIILGAGIPIVENLANLNLLPSGKEFLFIALPLKLQSREGSPCRAVAIVGDETGR